ncbi:MAG: molybdenum cofactor guanylyltransferase MobA [Janthinobacterium lividum]
MGGVDKGLQVFGDRPLAAHVFERLRPQVDEMFISANRHADWYAGLGAPVLRDENPSLNPSFEGPLAGILAGLRRAHREFLVVVPCDGPFLAADLVARLHTALLRDNADIACACTDAPTGGVDRHYVYALMRTTLAPDLSQYFLDGGRAVRAWYARHKLTEVRFDDPRSFYNINTAEALAVLERHSGPAPTGNAG